MSREPAAIGLSREQKRVLVADLLRRRSAQRRSFPLSFAQERLWFLDQLVPGDGFYNIPAVLRLPHALNYHACVQGLREIARRHDTLRTSFAIVDGRPAQVIDPIVSLDVSSVDLTGLPGSVREEEVLRIAGRESRRPFDLRTGPLLRVTLVSMGPADCLLLLTLHHIVADGWSLGVLLNEALTFYGAFSGGAPPPLRPLQLQYTDYAAWQRERLSGDRLAREVSYWRARLKNAPRLNLPTDRARPAFQSFRGVTTPLTIDREVADALRELSRREGVTLFMTLLAAFAVVLARHAGQDDISIGTPVANRTRTEIEGLIGFFVNTLVIRTDLSGIRISARCWRGCARRPSGRTRIRRCRSSSW